MKKSMPKKHNSGFLMLNAMFAAIIIAISMFALLELTMQINKAIRAYESVVNNSGGTPTFKCEVNQACNCEPIFCLYEPSNNKDIQSCAGGCEYINGQWEYEGQACTQGVVC